METIAIVTSLLAICSSAISLIAKYRFQRRERNNPKMLNKKSAEGQRQQQLRQMEEKIELMRSFSSSKSPQKNALEESFCDIFAVLVRNYHRDYGCYWNNPHNWLWDVGENFQEGTGSLRRLDKLLSLRFTDAGSVYGQIDWNTAENYHELSLIHSHAFYRLMTIHNTFIDGEPLFNGEFALKLFGAVLENILSLDNFLDSRRVFEQQAQRLLAPSPHIEVQLDAISQAFIDVGIE